MLVSPAQTSALPALSNGAGDAARHPANDSLRVDAPRHDEFANQREAAPVAAGPPTDTVTLSRPLAQAAEPAPAAVYAEVWKNGIKVAAIDSRGDVVSYVGPIAPPAGGVSGPWLAAIRAAQVAQSIDGEVHINGVTMDAGTIRTRVRLETAYSR